MNQFLLCVFMAALASSAAADGVNASNVVLKITLPRPTFANNGPKDFRSPNLEPARLGKPRPPVLVPVECDKKLSENCAVTSSDPKACKEELAFVTDGDKEQDPTEWQLLELAAGTQWVQVDLGAEKEIYAVCVWHHGLTRVYRDVICRISDDPAFAEGVVTVFNNDHDNSSGLGAGTDKEYIETFEGRPFAVSGVKGRYVRFYSKGSTVSDKSHYIEIEVYGKP